MQGKAQLFPASVFVRKAMMTLARKINEFQLGKSVMFNAEREVI